MEKTMLKINYRTLSGGEHSPWLQTSTLDEFIWGGAYELMFASDDGSHGLPFRFTQDEKVTLIVNDNNKGNTHGMHTIVQRLTYVEHATCDLVTYTRTRRDSNGNHLWSEWSVLDGATTSMLQDGSVTAQKLSTDVREKVDNALRPLFIAAGAEYNDSGADKTKTAPWGETVTHKAGHYYLNGLGDITEEQMMEIYNCKEAINSIILATSCDRLFQDSKSPRTFFRGYIGNRIFEGKTIGGYYILGGQIETVYFTPGNSTYYPNISKGEGFFYRCCKLKAVSVFKTSITSVFYQCESLEHIKVYISKSFNLSGSPIISKESILFIINNAMPTSAIAITLHTDAYNRLKDDNDIVLALQSQPLVSLVSA